MMLFKSGFVYPNAFNFKTEKSTNRIKP